VPTHARKPLLSLVVPFHDEEEAIGPCFAETLPILASVDGVQFEIVCVNDGSRDRTLERLLAIAAADSRVRVVDLTRRFGKEAALTAGLDEAAGAAVILIDADLQDPPALIPAMIERWRDGAEVVAAKRTDRMCDPYLQRAAAALYYRVHNALSEVEMPENVGDFRLMDREVVAALRALPQRRPLGVFRLAALEFRARRHHQLQHGAAARMDLRGRHVRAAVAAVWRVHRRANAAVRQPGARLPVADFGRAVRRRDSADRHRRDRRVPRPRLSRIEAAPVYLVRRRYRAEREAAAAPASTLLQFPLKRTHAARRRTPMPAGGNVAARKASLQNGPRRWTPRRNRCAARGGGRRGCTPRRVVMYSIVMLVFSALFVTIWAWVAHAFPSACRRASAPTSRCSGPPRT
jgi:glycosyltransferase involved in cell wall biosynthesis